MPDVNGTRFHLLLGEADWNVGRDSDLEWDRDRHGVRLRDHAYFFTARPGDARPTVEQRRGAARDRRGRWYFLDDGGDNILVADERGGRATVFWSTSDAQPEVVTPRNVPRPGPVRTPRIDLPRASPRPLRLVLRLAALTITTDHRLVVAAREDARTWLFVWGQDGDPPVRLPWPAAVPLTPFDMAPRPGGGLWLLDRVNARLWHLDRELRVVPPAAPTDVIPLATNAALTAAHAISVPPGSTAVEPVTDDLVLVLAHTDGASRIVALHTDGTPWGDPVPLDLSPVLPADASPADARLHAHDIAVVPHPDDPAARVLLAAAAHGNQTFAFTLTIAAGRLTLTAQNVYFPMRA